MFGTIFLVLYLIVSFTDAARYEGSKPQDAGQCLDASQGVPGEGHSALGHPRGHASDPNAQEQTPELDRICSVEKYSMESGNLETAKSGFANREDQNKVVHFALTSLKVQNALEKLNQGSSREAVTVPVKGYMSPVPRMSKWVRGRQAADWQNTTSIVLVLQNHRNQLGNPNHDVHIHTAYPK